LKSEGVGLIEGEPPSWLLDQIDLRLSSRRPDEIDDS
jgi:hypothetical protein